MPNLSRSGVVINPDLVVAATRVNGAKSILKDLAAGPFSYNQIKLKVFHGRIENFFYYGT
jgi:hypothetical protein